EGGDLHVHFGLVKAVAPPEREHSGLELSAGAVAGESTIKLKPEELCLTNGGIELGWGKKGTDVRESAACLGTRDVVAWSTSPGDERGGAVQDDSVATSFPGGARNGHVARAASPPPPAPDGRRTGRWIPQSSAALRWLRTAPSPQASTAA